MRAYAQQWMSGMESTIEIKSYFVARSQNLRKQLNELVFWDVSKTKCLREFWQFWAINIPQLHWIIRHLIRITNSSHHSQSNLEILNEFGHYRNRSEFTRPASTYGNATCNDNDAQWCLRSDMCISCMPKMHSRNRARKMWNQINNKNETMSTATYPPTEPRKKYILFLIENIFSVVNHSRVELLLGVPRLRCFFLCALHFGFDFLCCFCFLVYLFDLLLTKKCGALNLYVISLKRNSCSFVPAACIQFQQNDNQCSITTITVYTVQYALCGVGCELAKKTKKNHKNSWRTLFWHFLTTTISHFQIYFVF